MIESYLKHKQELKKLFSRVTMMYSLTSVLTKKILTSECDTTIFKNFLELEYDDRIKFDCAFLLYMAETEKIINYYKTFHDEIKKDLCQNQSRNHKKNYYEKFKKLADDTLLETKKHVQTES